MNGEQRQKQILYRFKKQQFLTKPVNFFCTRQQILWSTFLASHSCTVGAEGIRKWIEVKSKNSKVKSKNLELKAQK